MSWENLVRRVEPYVAGEQPKEANIIKLNTNECPYPPAPGVQAAMQELAYNYDRFRLYPDMDATRIVNALADYYKVDPAQVFVGVGSDDVISMSFLTYYTSGKRLLFPDITYSFYDVWANLYQIPFTQIPLQDDYSIDPADYIPASVGGHMETTVSGLLGETVINEEIGGIIFPNPNAPTGLELADDTVERIVKANPDKIVIVDEAYVDFGARSALPLIDKYENLLVVQTMSKSRAAAGLRIGYAFGSKKIIAYLKDVKFSFNSYTMNMPSIVLGEAAIKDADYFHKITAEIIETRERFKSEIAALGFTFPDSKSNFLFAHHPEMHARDLFQALRERHIYVRYFDKPRINEYLRITIGTPEQMDALVAAFKEILNK